MIEEYTLQVNIKDNILYRKIFTNPDGGYIVKNMVQMICTLALEEIGCVDKPKGHSC